MSSLKDDFHANKFDMSVTPPVSHVEMWPYVRMAAARSENQSKTAVLIVLSSATMGVAVGAAVVGAGVAVGSDVGAGVGAGVDVGTGVGARVGAGVVGARVGAGVKVGAGVDVGANDGRRVGQGVQYVGAPVVGMELGAARATSQISR